MEADWKKFRTILPALRERFLAERNVRFARLLTDPTKTETERFWDAMEEMGKVEKTLTACLDGHTRSKIWLYLMTMRKACMVKREDMADFSDELRRQVFDEQF